jgi:hypothetical protein
MLKLSCPLCAQQFFVPTEYAGSEVACGACKGLIRIPTVTAAVTVSCPACAAVLNAPLTISGTKAKCPGCGQRLQIPDLRNKTVLAPLVPEPPPLPIEASASAIPPLPETPSSPVSFEPIGPSRRASRRAPRPSAFETEEPSSVDEDDWPPRRTSTAMRFRNPANGYEEEASLAWLWVLLFGAIYFAVKGVWTHAIVGILLAIPTYGLSWLIYPFFASEIMRRHYLRQGWREVKTKRSLADHQDLVDMVLRIVGIGFVVVLFAIFAVIVASKFVQ